MISVQTNLAAMYANNQLNRTGCSLAKSTRKLSSGYRINQAADDAASLAVSEKMRRQIRGLSQASSNCQDGVSYCQVADGALSESQDILQRINELTIKAATETITTEDRASIDAEVKQLKSELNRIFTDTSFNERKIWNDDSIVLDSVLDHIEYKQAATISAYAGSIDINDNNKETMPKTSFTVHAGSDPDQPGTYGLKVSWTGYDNAVHTSELIPWPEPATASNSFQLADYLPNDPKYSGIDAAFSYSTDNLATLDQIKTALDGVTLWNSISTTTTATISPAVSGLSARATINYQAMLDSGKTFDNYDDVFIVSKPAGNNLVETPSWDSRTGNWKFDFEMPGIGKVTATSGGVSYSCFNREDAYENDWWEWIEPINSAPYKYPITHAASQSNGSLSGVDYAFDTNTRLNMTTMPSNGTMEISFNLKKSSDGTSVGSVTLSMGVGTNDTYDSIVNKLKDMKNIQLTSPNGTADRLFVNDRSHRTSEVAHNVYKHVYADEIDVMIQAGSEGGQHIDIRYKNLDLDVLGIKDTSVSTVKDARAAINQVKDALSFISGQRAGFGAYQNRLEHTIANLDNIVENTQDAESTLRDTDMADEAVNESRLRILSQAGQSMLSQANRSREGILQLLQ